MKTISPETKNGQPKPWRENSNSFLVIYSILAATCGVFIALIFQDSSICRYWWVPVISLAVAFWLFVFSAEGLTEALDEDDVEKYLSLVFVYNVATWLLFGGVFFSIYLHYIYTSFHSWWLSVMVFVLPGGRWFLIAGWFFVADKEEYQNYKEEILGGNVTINRQWTRLFLSIRRLLHQ